MEDQGTMHATIPSPELHGRRSGQARVGKAGRAWGGLAKDEVRWRKVEVGIGKAARTETNTGELVSCERAAKRQIPISQLLLGAAPQTCKLPACCSIDRLVRFATLDQGEMHVQANGERSASENPCLQTGTLTDYSRQVDAGRWWRGKREGAQLGSHASEGYLVTSSTWARWGRGAPSNKVLGDFVPTRRKEGEHQG